MGLLRQGLLYETVYIIKYTQEQEAAGLFINDESIMLTKAQWSTHPEQIQGH